MGKPVELFVREFISIWFTVICKKKKIGFAKKIQKIAVLFLNLSSYKLKFILWN